MLDRDRILTRIDELDSYLKELNEIAPGEYSEYLESIEKKRSCERLLQISIECVIDVCSLIVTGLKLGVPSSEEDLFTKLGERNVLSEQMVEKLKQMKGFRNILVHRYGTVDDQLVYDSVKNKLKDFQKFKKEVVDCLSNKTG